MPKRQLKYVDEQGDPSNKLHKTVGNPECLHELSHIFPVVICELILSFDYHFQGTLDWELPNKLIVEHVSSFEDGRIIGAQNQCVVVWDGTSGNTLWQERRGRVFGIKVLPRDMFLVHAAEWAGGCQVGFFDSLTYEKLTIVAALSSMEVLQTEDDNVVRIVNFAYKHKVLDFWSYTRGGEPVHEHKCVLEEKVSRLSVLPNSQFVVVSTDDFYDSCLHLFQYVGKELSQLSRQQFPAQYESAQLRFSIPTPDGGVLFGGACYNHLTTERHGYLIFIKDMNTMKEIVFDDCSEISAASFLTNQSRVLCASDSLFIYDLATGTKELTLCEFAKDRSCFAVLPNEDVAVIEVCGCPPRVYNTKTWMKSGFNHMGTCECAGFVDCYSSGSPSLTLLSDERLACFSRGLKIYR